MSLARTPEQCELASLLEQWATDRDIRAGQMAAIQADTPAADDLFAELARLGILGLAVSEEHGGTGGGPLEAAVAVEALGRHLMPTSVLADLWCAAILTDANSPQVAELAQGRSRGAVAFEGACAPGVAAADLVLTVSDRVRLVRGPGAAVDVLALTGDWGTVSAQGEPVDTDGASAGLLGITLALADLSGVCRWATETAVAHARTREQFGVPIGTFQGVSHLVAGMHLATETVTSAAYEALDGLTGDDPEQAELAVTAAGSVGLTAAVRVTLDLIQVLGGIGYTYEHPAHLALRRAKSWQLLLDPGQRLAQRVAELSRGGVRRTPPTVSGELPPGLEQAVDRVAERPAAEHRQALIEEGLLRPDWPRPWGLDADPLTAGNLAARLASAGVEVPDLVIAGWTLGVIAGHGSDELRQELIPAGLAGEEIWCQLFSEPGAGSDLASVRTRAVRVDGGWSVSGQKVWTSLAREARWGLALVRTDPNENRHRGLSVLVVEMASDGIEVRPLREATGEALFNEVFLDDVFVPDARVVGEIGGGWRVATATLAGERIAMGVRPSLPAALEKLVAEPGGVAEVRLGGLVARTMVKAAGERRLGQALIGGAPVAGLATVQKLIGVRLDQELREACLDAQGTAGCLNSEQTRGFLASRALSIAGGTTQVLLNVLAERVLGLPKPKG